MKQRNLLSIFAIVFGAFAALGQTNLQQKYVGKTDCLPEIKAASEHYGIRLDKSQNAYLTAYRLNDENILSIVQFQNNRDHCRIIRDVIQSRDKNSSFLWECKARNSPSDVVVGTWPAKHPKSSGPAIEAWRIDLAQLKFVPVRGTPVSCVAGDYAGSDNGDDLASWAKKRAVEHSTSSQAK